MFARNGSTTPEGLVRLVENLLPPASFARAVAPEADLFDEVTQVVLELAAAHPGPFAHLA